jgi:hypothetical protein
MSATAFGTTLTSQKVNLGVSDVRERPCWELCRDALFGLANFPPIVVELISQPNVENRRERHLSQTAGFHRSSAQAELFDVIERESRKPCPPPLLQQIVADDLDHVIA